MNDKFSAENQDKLYNVFSNRNASALHEAGFQATAENLHLSHFAGAKGAVRILKADPNTLVGTAMGHKEKLANGEDNPVWKTNKSVFDQTVGQYRAGLSKMHGNQPSSQTQLAEIPSSMEMGASQRDPSFDPARIEEIANYRRTVPEKASENKGAGITVNNIDNSKKTSSTSTTSSGAMVSAYNNDIINLLLDRATNSDLRYG